MCDIMNLKGLKNFYRNISLKYKFLLLFYIQIIIPLMFIGFTSFYKSSEVIKSKSINYSQDILKMIELRFNDMSTDMNVLTTEFLYDNRIYNILKTKNTPADILGYYSNISEVKNFLRQSTLSRNEVQSIAIVTKDKTFYTFDSYSTKANIEKMMPFDYLFEETSKKGNGKIVWVLDKRDNNTVNVYITRMINDRDTFEEIGLIVILIKKEFLQSVYSDLSNEFIDNISILSDNNEEIITGTNPQYNLLPNLHIENLNAPSGYYIDKKSNSLVSYVSLENPKWKIVYNISLKTLYHEIDALKEWTYLTLLCSLLILSVLSILTAVDIVTPVYKLIDGMKKVERGEKHKDIALNRNDELGYLSESFNKMSKQIDYLVNRIYAEELTLKEAEIRALQAQINPHFLFNTLESINWMAQLNGVPEISEIVSALSKLMDASIGRDDKLISIREEFNYIENYIIILKTRYEDKLEVIEEIDEEILDVSIPRLLVQPLVENAVYHGIEKNLKKGEILLKAHKENNDIIIQVRDNGPGMTLKELEAINIKLNSSDNVYEVTNKKRKSIGLENVNKRIKLFYGNEYGLRIESEKDEFTNAIIKIPIKNNIKGESFYVQSSNS